MKIASNRLYFTFVIILLQLVVLYSLFTTSASAAGTGYIMGRVTMPDDATGIANCQVELQGKDDAGLARLNTDAQGNFYITNLVPTDETWGYRLVVTKDNWGQSITQHFSVEDNASTIVAIRMYPYIGRMTMDSDTSAVNADGTSTAIVSVSMSDVNGKPVPDGMNVKLTQDAYYPNPGIFIDGSRNGTELTVPTRNGKVAVQYGNIPQDSLARGVKLSAQSVEMSGSSSSLDLAIKLTNPNTITGTVYDLTMQPVPNAKVYLSRWDGVSRYVGYNSTETGNRTDGSGFADANGTYRFTVMPAGDYQVSASESIFNNSTKVKVVRGTYGQDIILPINRGGIKGWVNDAGGKLVPGVNVTLYRVYQDRLTKMASTLSESDGSFAFDDIWYGNYDIQASIGDQTADVPLVLDVSKASAAIALHHIYTAGTPIPSVSPGPNVSVTPRPNGTGGKTVTPKPPTPTPYPVTPENLAKTYGIGIGVVAAICAGIVLIVLRFRPKE